MSAQSGRFSGSRQQKSCAGGGDRHLDGSRNRFGTVGATLRNLTRTKAIVITAREDLAARATAMAIGPVAFFMKPFDDEKFIGAVRDALSQA